jgi:hypothetical protein
MPWNWDWTLDNKFPVICRELGGGYINNGGYENRSINEHLCEFDDIDGFKAFSHWLNRLPQGHKYKDLKAYYHMEDGYDFFEMTFGIFKDNPTKILRVEEKTPISSGDTLDEYIFEKLGETTTDNEVASVNWNKICINAASKKVIDTIKKPYLIPHTTLDVDFFEDGFYSKTTIDIPINEGSVLSSVIDDADNTASKLNSQASDIFHIELEKEIERVKTNRR